MKLISELPEPYKSLAELRREQIGIPDTYDFSIAFPWENAPEPEGFWSAVYDGELPVIPVKSIEELKGSETFPIPEYTGGSVSYYKIKIENPTTAPEPYTAECNDIIEALGMDYAEGNAFKAIWRACAARKGMVKKGYDSPKYDWEKVKFFAERKLSQIKE